MRPRTAWLASVVLATLLGCGDDGGTSGAGSSNGTVGASSGAGASATGSGAAGTGGGAGAAGGDASGSATGSGGGLPACVTDVVLLAEAGQSVDCSYPLPPGVDDGNANVVLEVGAAPQQLCRRASSQGCDVQTAGGWWTVGEDILLCDSSCTTLVETPGAKLYLWVGCPSDNCL